MQIFDRKISVFIKKSCRGGVRTCGPKFLNLPDRTLIAYGNPYSRFLRYIQKSGAAVAEWSKALAAKMEARVRYPLGTLKNFTRKLEKFLYRYFQ